MDNVGAQAFSGINDLQSQKGINMFERFYAENYWLSRLFWQATFM